MRIIQIPIIGEPTPAREAPVAPVTPALASEPPKLIQDDLEKFKTETLSVLRLLQERVEQVNKQTMDQVRRNSEAIQKLTEGIEKLQKTVAEMPHPASPPSMPMTVLVEIKPEEKENPLPHGLLDDVAGSIPESSGKKVAFLRKLWDYLNQVAFEIPLGKSSRTP